MPTKTTTFSNGFYLKLEWNYTQDIPLNRSRITYSATIGYLYPVTSSAAKDMSVSFNSVVTNHTFTIGNHTTNNWSKQIIVNNVQYVYHSPAGTANLDLQVIIYPEITLGGQYIDYLVVHELQAPLPAIPRASSFAAGTLAATTGVSMPFSIVPASSGFTHTVLAKLGSHTSTLDLAAGVNSGSFMFGHHWGTAFPNTNSSTVTLTLQTKSGGTVIATSTKTLVLTLAAGQIPSPGSVTASRNNGRVPAAWAIYVQNESTVTLTSNPTGINGSTITSITLTLAGVTKTFNAATATATWALPISGTLTCNITVKDSRGRTANMNQGAVLYVYPYSPPTLAAGRVARASSGGVEIDTGTYARFYSTYIWVNVASKNALTTKIEYKPTNSSTWVSPAGWTLPVSGGAVTRQPAGGFLLNMAYDIRYTITDSIGNKDEWVTRLSSEFVTMDLLKGGRGVAFGKSASMPDTLETEFFLQANKGMNVRDGVNDLLNLNAAFSQMTGPASSVVLNSAGTTLTGPVTLGSTLGVEGAAVFASPVSAPAGFAGQRLPAGANLNNYTTPGQWYEGTSANVAAMSNTPPSNIGGVLQVFQTAGPVQIWHDYDTGALGRSWRRRFYGGSWSAWEWYAGNVSGGSSTSGWEQLPGGLQFCWFRSTANVALNAAYGSLFIGSYTWTFPRAFTHNPSVAVGKMQWGSGASWGVTVSTTTASAVLRGFDILTRASGTTAIDVLAVGYGAI